MLATMTSSIPTARLLSIADAHGNDAYELPCGAVRVLLPWSRKLADGSLEDGCDTADCTTVREMLLALGY